MNVYDVVANNILYYMEQLENDKDFKKVKEWLENEEKN